MSDAAESGHASRLFIVANGSRGRAYAKRLGESGYDALMEWDEPDARRRDAELGEDRPGRAFASAGSTQRSGMEREGVEDSPKQQAKLDLARRMAEDVAEELRSGRAETFALIAPAPVAAQFLQAMPAEQRRALTQEDHRDLTSLPLAELFERLDALRHGV